MYPPTDQLSLVLVRWYEAHPSTSERDKLCRPLCPGPLRNNHCLWQYAETARPRRVMTNADGSPCLDFKNSGSIFGRTPATRMSMWNDEQHAYFGLITPSSIISTVHMSRECDSDSMTHTNTWLQTVTIV